MYRLAHRLSPGKKLHRRLLALTTALVLTVLVVACGEPEPEPRAEPADTPRALNPLSWPTDRPRPTVTPILDATAVVVVTKAPTPTAAPTPTLPPPADINGDYDADADGLIEVSNLAQLDAIRYDMDGNGLVADSKEQTEYLAAFPGALEDMGCPVGGCSGYEVVSDLDFDTNGNGLADAGDVYWNDGSDGRHWVTTEVLMTKGYSKLHLTAVAIPSPIYSSAGPTRIMSDFSGLTVAGTSRTSSWSRLT